MTRLVSPACRKTQEALAGVAFFRSEGRRNQAVIPADGIPLFPTDECLDPASLAQEPAQSDLLVWNKYDTVVVASAGAYLFPGTEGLLSGEAVYTVYLRAASGPDWVLQFCARDSNPNELRGTGGSLHPPYPVHAVRPELALAPEVEYMVIHGTINTQGRFEKLAIVGEQPLRPDPDRLLRSLSEWELQPATIEGSAVPVDVVLIVPNAAS
jgi:hypothetical protein